MNDEQRKRYFENISAHRPYELELLRWNYDPEDDSQTAFQQLECLVGQHRQLRDSRPGGGIKWIPLELAGVFVRHRYGRAIVWLPEAGSNFLLQAVPGGTWLLVEVGHMEKRRVVVDKTKLRGGAEASVSEEVAFLTR